MDNGNYLKKLRDDMIEQFKGKPNIEVFQAALARQLSDVYAFFDELNSRRWFDGAEGVQLDGIGNIVVMSRAEALAVSKQAEQNIPMEDETYRLYLAWKNALNTTNCTHKDRHSALKMFWKKAPIYYSENPEHPATIFLRVPASISESGAAVFRIASMVKAAGVTLHFIFTGDAYTTPDYDGAAIVETIKEYLFDEVEIVSEITTAAYAGSAIYETIKEIHANG